MHKLLLLLLLAFLYMFAATAAVSRHGQFEDRKRPRLFASLQDIKEIKQNLKQPDYAGIAAAYDLLYEGDLKYGPKADVLEPGKVSGEWRRSEGDALIGLAIMYKITGDRKYLKTAIEFINAITNYKEWDSRNRVDLVTGHLLLALSVAYDWLNEDLNDQIKKAICEKVKHHAQRGVSVLKAKCLFENGVQKRGWNWRRRLLNNHGEVTITGLLAAGIAFAGQIPESAEWRKQATQYLDEWMKAQPVDGGAYEGVGYLEYSLGHAIMFADMMRDNKIGHDYFRSDWMKNMGMFRIHSSMPRNYWYVVTINPKRWHREHEKRMADIIKSGKYPLKQLNVLQSGVLSFSDCRQKDFILPAGFLWKLAAEYDDSEMKKFADILADTDNCFRRSHYLNMLYFHAARKHKWNNKPVPLPAFRHYPDLGIVFMRSGWDGNENQLIFRCGPPTGHTALNKFNHETGDGHVHPDVGAFSLFAAGDLMIINSDYSFKDTKQENTLLVNGVGQVGDQCQWSNNTEYYLKKLNPHIVTAQSSNGYNYTKDKPHLRLVLDKDDCDYVVGDATAAYRPAAGLKCFKRHILFLKPDCWVIMDEVKSDKPAKFDLLFHSMQEIQVNTPRSATITGRNGILNIRSILPENAELRASSQVVDLIDGLKDRPTQLLTLSSDGKSDSELFLTVLTADKKAAKQQELKCSIVKNKSGWTLSIIRNGKVRKINIIDDTSGDETKKAADVLPIFRNGETVCFAGDSITANGGYMKIIGDYYVTRYPDRKINFVNCGVGGDWAEDLLERLDSDVLSHKPDWLFVMLGMNDMNRRLYGSKEVTQSQLDKRLKCKELYAANLEKLLVRLQKSGVKHLVLMGPTIYDEYTTGGRSENNVGANDALADFNKIAAQAAARHKIPFIDQRSQMLAMTRNAQRGNPAFSLLRTDRIHPDMSGHYCIANQILAAQKQTAGFVDRVIDLKAMKTGSGVANLKKNAGSIFFELHSQALPMYLNHAIMTVPEIKHFFTTLNRKLLLVHGLSSGKYELLINGKSMGIYSADQLSTGIDLAGLPENPWRKESDRACYLNQKKVQFEVKKIRIPMSGLQMVTRARRTNRKLPENDIAAAKIIMKGVKDKYTLYKFNCFIEESPKDVRKQTDKILTRMLENTYTNNKPSILKCELKEVK